METKSESELLEGAQLAFSLASQLIYFEPQEAQISSFVGNRMFRESPFGKGNASVDSGLKLLDGWCVAVATDTEEQGITEAVAALKREWFALFVGAGTPLAPSWESFYVEPNSMLFGKATLDVRTRYRRWGLQIEKLHSEPDDNLGLILGFVGHLIGVEREAEALGDGVGADARDAQEAFLVEHVLPWLPAWHYQALKHARSDFYRGVAELTFGIVQEYALRFGTAYRPDKEAFIISRPEALREADAHVL